MSYHPPCLPRALLSLQGVHDFFRLNPGAPPLQTGTVNEEAAGTSSGQQQADKPKTTMPRAGRICIEFVPSRAQSRNAGAVDGEGTGGGAGSEAGQAGGGGRGGRQAARGRRGGRGRGRDGGRGQGDQQQLQWGGGPECKYVKFVLYKENMETQVRGVGYCCKHLQSWERWSAAM